jgi:cyclic pyranopterin phosphate synthase
MIRFDPYEKLKDAQDRRVEYLRLSVTDRCNYRCVYCMPARGVTFVPRSEVLQYDELLRLVRVFVSMGIARVRITGGEPLVRKELVPKLIAPLCATPGVGDVAMTTNGHLLAEHAQALVDAGMRRVNVSLDTLDADTFTRITRGGDLAAVLRGLEAARRAGLEPVKLNAVIVGGQNEHEAPALVRFAAEHGYVLRFIEYMPIGTDETWDQATWVPIGRMRQALALHYAFEETAPVVGGGPAVYARLTPRDGGHSAVKVGFISALSENFCAACNRVRVTAEGRLRECLSRDGSLSLRDLLRSGADDDTVRDAIRGALFGKAEGHAYGVEHGHVRTARTMSSIGG